MRLAGVANVAIHACGMRCSVQKSWATTSFTSLANIIYRVTYFTSVVRSKTDQAPLSEKRQRHIVNFKRFYAKVSRTLPPYGIREPRDFTVGKKRV